MRFPPYAKQLELRVAITALSLFYLAYAGMNIRIGLNGNWISGILGAFVWLPVSAGLSFLKNVARVAALIFHWTLFFLIPFGILSPFAQMEHAFGNPGPTLGKLFSLVLALGTVNCYAIFVLTKYKSQFVPLRGNSG
jgi:hypothetical protein